MQRLVRWFVVVGAVVGVLFAVLSPPFASPDEATHFFRAYQLSEGHVFADRHGHRVGGMLPSSVEHDVHLVMATCSQIHVLDFGVVIAEGGPDDIRSNQTVLDAYLGESLS